jgi:nifR3 family TIM-barrel protein
MVRAIDKVAEARPNLIDINYGCPVKQVVCKEAGSGMLRNIPKLLKITEAMVKRSPLPITVKTRLGWDEDSKQVVYLAEALQDIGVQAIAIHGRTRVQMYKGSADWTLIGEVKNNARMHIPVFGNGDIDSPEKAVLYKNRYGVDGIMIGRAAIGYPWIFSEIKHFMATGENLAAPSTLERIDVCLRHFERSLEWKGEKLGILEMRRHYTNYFKGYPNFKEYRMQMVQSLDAEEIRQLLRQVEAQYAGYEPQIIRSLGEVSYSGCD